MKDAWKENWCCAYQSGPHLWALLAERLQATCDRSGPRHASQLINTMCAVVLPPKGIYVKLCGTTIISNE